MLVKLRLLSVIIPAYNAAYSIATAIDSVLNQDYTNFELIIINDGSSDGTAKVMERYITSEKRVRMVSKCQNEGVAAARNTGLEVAVGEYIAFLDADDRVAPTMYSRLISTLEEYSCDMAMCRIAYEYSRDSRNEIEVLPTIKEGILSEPEYQRIVNGLVNARHSFFGGIVRYVFKKEVLKDCRFDTRISYREDLVFLFELLCSKRKIYYADFVGYYYIRNSRSAVEQYREDLFENLMYVNQRIFSISRKNGVQQEKLYSFKILEAVSLAISNLYRRNAPERETREYINQISKLSKVLEDIRNIKLINSPVKYKPLIILMKIKAYWLIHIIYKWKEKERQKSIDNM